MNNVDAILARTIALIEDPNEPYLYMDSTQCGVAKLYKAVTGSDCPNILHESGADTQTKNDEFASVLYEVNKRLALEPAQRNITRWWRLSDHIADYQGARQCSDREAAVAVFRAAMEVAS